jgi:hypothetical protein
MTVSAEGSTHFHKREQASFGACIVDRLRHGWRARPQGCGLSTMQAPKEVCVFEDKMLRSLTVAARLLLEYHEDALTLCFCPVGLNAFIIPIYFIHHSTILGNYE